jgi:hypothetical protein
MLTAVVVLHLMVYDTETGAVLFARTRDMPSFVNSIENCRKVGIEKAQRLAGEYRKTYPAASVNIDCEWRRGIPTDPA